MTKTTTGYAIYFSMLIIVTVSMVSFMEGKITRDYPKPTEYQETTSR